MSPELKQLWLNALKSGRYRHIRYRLFSKLNTTDSDHPKCACAIGVLLLELEAHPDLCPRKTPIVIDKSHDAVVWNNLPYHRFPPKEVLIDIGLAPVLASNASLNNDSADSYQYAIEYIEEKL